jgi:hypothetical protein
MVGQKQQFLKYDVQQKLTDLSRAPYSQNIGRKPFFFLQVQCATKFKHLLLRLSSDFISKDQTKANFLQLRCATKLKDLLSRFTSDFLSKDQTKPNFRECDVQQKCYSLT